VERSNEEADGGGFARAWHALNAHIILRAQHRRHRSALVRVQTAIALGQKFRGGTTTTTTIALLLVATGALVVCTCELGTCSVTLTAAVVERLCVANDE
jgi:hypothetical protein